MAASNTIVDLSEDNDLAGINTAAVAAVPSSNPPDAFERSCDNPECSAPKLISQVPKRDTSEFITEPMVMDQPTLINGFTTVFQIDGVGTRMEDLMKESEAAENAPDQNHKPKTVFRVVPNTHAHIVNYVVVDAAGETMRKIKANDPETIRKLLVSQRLSAEQMLKKLIGKALDTPARTENPFNTPVSLSGPAPPVSVAAPMPPAAPKLTSATVFAPAPKLAMVPVLAQPSVATQACFSTPATISISAPISTLGTNPAPAHKTATAVKPAIKLKPVAALKPAPQFKPTPELKQAPAPKLALAPKPSLIPKPAPVALLTSAPVSDPTSVSSRNDHSTPKFPPGITIKLLSNTEANKTPSPSAPSTSVVVSSPTNRQVPQSLSSLIQKAASPPSQPTAAAQTKPTQTAAVGRAIPTSKPVIWQAVAPGFASKLTPLKTIPQGTTPTLSHQSTNPGFVSPTKMTLSSLSISPSQQPALAFKEIEMLDVEKSIPATSLTVTQSHNDSPSVKQTNVLKRKLDPAKRVPEAVKRLRPRSPSRKQNASPLAGNLQRYTNSPPSTRKLPTLSKLQMQQISNKTGPKVKKILSTPIAEEDPATIPDAGSNSNTQEEDSSKPSLPTKLDTPLRRKGKPLMGPASKMKALKAISDAKSQALQNDNTSESKPPLISDNSSTLKIGETIITRTGLLRANKEIIESQPPEILTKPCSVAITDIVKSSTATDSDSDSKTKRSKPNSKASIEKKKSLPTEKDRNSPPPHASLGLMDKLRGRWTLKRLENEKSLSVRTPRTTRSRVGTPKTSTETRTAAAEEISGPALLTSPSAPSRVLRVVLPSQNNGVVNNPPTSPHPNLKISSVISSGIPLSGTLEENDIESVPLIINDDSSDPGIEQLQKELADLRRTVDRLTQGKKV